MNINCYTNAKVYFKLAYVRVRVRVRVRAYPHFPTTPQAHIERNVASIYSQTKNMIDTAYDMAYKKLTNCHPKCGR